MIQGFTAPYLLLCGAAGLQALEAGLYTVPRTSLYIIYIYVYVHMKICTYVHIGGT